MQINKFKSNKCVNYDNVNVNRTSGCYVFVSEFINRKFANRQSAYCC